MEDHTYKLYYEDGDCTLREFLSKLNYKLSSSNLKYFFK